MGTQGHLSFALLSSVLVYEFLVAAITNDCKPRSLKQHRFIDLAVLEVKISKSPWTMSRWSAFLWDALKGILFPCLLQGKAAHIPWLMVPCSIHQSQQHLSVFLLFPTSPIKDSCDYLGLAWVIHDNLSTWRSVDQ